MKSICANTHWTYLDSLESSGHANVHALKEYIAGSLQAKKACSQDQEEQSFPEKASISINPGRDTQNVDIPGHVRYDAVYASASMSSCSGLMLYNLLSCALE